MFNTLLRRPAVPQSGGESCVLLSGIIYVTFNQVTKLHSIVLDTFLRDFLVLDNFQFAPIVFSAVSLYVINNSWQFLRNVRAPNLWRLPTHQPKIVSSRIIYSRNGFVGYHIRNHSFNPFLDIFEIVEIIHVINKDSDSDIRISLS